MSVVDRMSQEVSLLRLHYERVDHLEHGGAYWFAVGRIKTPPGCAPGAIDALFSVTTGYPGAPPYGFFVPAELTINGQPPAVHAPPNAPPFDGRWLFLSWTAENWRATADVRSGSNLWGWVRGFQARLAEGP